jgi:hypothetical protein
MNVQEVLNIAKERKLKNKDSIKKIIDNIHKKIKFYANLNKESCEYQIPVIIDDRPLYNVDFITKQVFKTLDSEGFIVTAYSDGRLEIFWKESLVEQKVKTDAYLISEQERKLKNITKKSKKVDERFAFLANPVKTAKLPQTIEEQLDLQVEKILKEKEHLQNKYKDILKKSK